MKGMKGLTLWFVLVTLIFTCVGCSTTKTPITAEDFKSKMEDQEFDVQDLTSQFEGQVDNLYVALKDEDYQIEFWVVPTEKLASAVFLENKEIFEAQKESNSAYTSVSVGNFSKYTLKSGGKYMAISQIDNTFIYINTDSSHEKEIKSILKDLGY